MKALEELRQDYQKGELIESQTPSNPMDYLAEWLELALNSDLIEPNAMCLSTINAKGRPSSRIVLLKGLDETGLVFYTNYLSRKGKEIAASPFAAINIFWDKLERQIRVEGKIEKVDPAVSAEYFSVRPRKSQIGAWSSLQSSNLSGRSELESKFTSFEKHFENVDEIPKPDFWGGYRLVPDYFEFWQGRRSRLHDRIIYSINNENQWTKGRLSP